MTEASPPLAVDGLTFRYRSAAAPSISDLNFVATTGDLLLIGPTLTNVNDVRVILVDRLA